MKKIVLGLICLLVVLPFIIGCTSTTVEIEADLGEEFLLPIGQEARITGENLQIRFKDVIGDSRCPEGAICIWEGEASCLVEITYSGVVSSKVLVQPGLSGPPETGFGDYRIAFDVQPYPEVGKEIKKKDYRLKMVVSKKSAAP